MSQRTSQPWYEDPFKLILVIGGGILAAIFIAIPIIVAGILSVIPCAFTGGCGSSSSTFPIPASSSASSDIPPDQLSMLLGFKSQCGVPWTVIGAIGKIESDFGRGKNPAGQLTMYIPHDGGIIGWGQFDPDTWKKYGQGGDIFSAKDSISAIDRDLCANGAAKDLSQALWQFSGCVPGTKKSDGSICVRTDRFVEQYLQLAQQYSLIDISVPIGPIPCNRGPAFPGDYGASLFKDFGLYLFGYSPTHMQWAWENFCQISATKFDSLVQGSRIQISSLGDSQQVGCPGSSTSVLLGPFSDKATFQVALDHELGHVVFNCRVKGTSLEAVFSTAHSREGGISYYAQNAKACTGSDSYSEDAADTIAYYLNPGMKRSMLKCETNAGIFNAPDLSKFPLHVAWARAVLGDLRPPATNQALAPFFVL